MGCPYSENQESWGSKCSVLKYCGKTEAQEVWPGAGHSMNSVDCYKIQALLHAVEGFLCACWVCWVNPVLKQRCKGPLQCYKDVVQVVNTLLRESTRCECPSCPDTGHSRTASLGNMHFWGLFCAHDSNRPQIAFLRIVKLMQFVAIQSLVLGI